MSDIEVRSNSSSNSLINKAFIIAEHNSPLTETSCSSVFSLDCTKESELVSELPLKKCDISNFNKSNWDIDSGIIDSASNVFESTNLIKCNCIAESFGENPGVMSSEFIKNINDIKIKSTETKDDDEFHDAVQFFNDPLFKIFLENSNNAKKLMTLRSSLYQKFDPLYSKYSLESNIKSTQLKESSKENNFKQDMLDIVVSSGNVKERRSEFQDNVKSTELLSNELQLHVHNAARTSDNPITDFSSTSCTQSFGNDLISFDLPIVEHTSVRLESISSWDSKIFYSEEELRQALKMQKLLLQEKYLRKQKELEERFFKRQKELNEKLKQQKLLSKTFRLIIGETMDIACDFYDKTTVMKNKLQSVENENNELKLDINKSINDLRDVENAFSNLHKRYEQCKNMLNVYIENERNLMQQLEYLKLQLSEREMATKTSQSCIEKELATHNAELAVVRKTLDNQIDILMAQIQLAKSKISGFESNLILVKTENEKLNVLYNNIMSKIRKT